MSSDAVASLVEERRRSDDERADQIDAEIASLTGFTIPQVKLFMAALGTFGIDAAWRIKRAQNQTIRMHNEERRLGGRAK